MSSEQTSYLFGDRVYDDHELMRITIVRHLMTDVLRPGMLRSDDSGVDAVVDAMFEVVRKDVLTNAERSTLSRINQYFATEAGQSWCKGVLDKLATAIDATKDEVERHEDDFCQWKQFRRKHGIHGTRYDSHSTVDEAKKDIKKSLAVYDKQGLIKPEDRMSETEAIRNDLEYYGSRSAIERGLKEIESIEERQVRYAPAEKPSPVRPWHAPKRRVAKPKKDS